MTITTKSKVRFEQVKKTKDNKILFSFEYIYFDSLENCEKAIPIEDDDEGTILNTNQYERNLFIKYWYDILANAKKKADNDEEQFYYTDVLCKIIRKVKEKNSPFKEFHVFKLFSEDKFCKELTDIEFVQKILKESINEKGYPSISDDAFYCNEIVLLTIKKYTNLLMKDIKQYLKRIDFSKFEKMYYSKQFDKYVELIHLDKESKVYNFLEYRFYNKLRLFNNGLINPTKYLSYKWPSTGEISEYLNFLFDKPRRPGIFKMSEVTLSTYISDECYREYETLDNFINNILTKSKKTELSLRDFSYVENTDYMLSILKNALENKTKGINILLYGKPGTGKTELSKVLIKEAKANGYEVKNPKSSTFFNYDNESCFDRKYTFCNIRRMLQYTENSVILFDEAEDYFRKRDETDMTKINVNQLLEENDTPTIWTTNNIMCLEESFRRRFTYVYEVEYMPKRIYEKIYKKLCKEYNIKENKDVLDFCFLNKTSIGIIKKAFETYKLTKVKNEDEILDDIKNTLKVISYEIKECKNSARPKEFDYRLLNTSDDLEKLSDNIKKTNRLDFSLLLHGVSGSGKSYFAEYLAKKLNLPIIKKKASDLESCWVGETEKNIAKAFEEAKLEKAVLVIDEGDHFIADRSNSHYSWERSRTEEMLQQIEFHPYPVIFTTNLMQNIDKAAMRRFTYKTKFDYLTKDQVKIAWKDYFKDAKLPKDIYLSKLCPGDFSTVYKKASFEGYLDDSDKLYQKLKEEQDMKKEDEMENSSIRF